MAIVNKPSDHFTTFLWTGDGTTPKSHTGVGFQADMMWSKIRTSVHQHNIVDTVRGVNQRLIVPNSTNAEDTTCTHGHFDSLDSDGFTTTNAGGNWNVNTSGNTYVGWLWKAGGTAVSNTAGSITSSVSANTTSGFSVVTWTGTGVAGTVGTGLSVTPKITIVKGREAVTNWIVGGSLIVDVGGSTNNYMILNGSAAMDSATTLYASYNPTTVGVKTDANINGSGQGMVMYCFAEVKGFSKFGSYTGNGSTDGTFVYTGFKPAFLITKKTSATAPWDMFDDTRNVINPVNSRLHPNASDTEFTNSAMNIDFVSNGFKIRTTDNELNTSGATYIYMAFAEQPFVTSTDNGSIPATAR
jgi:hypothetical protein